jgi:hypothetical protein
VKIRIALARSSFISDSVALLREEYTKPSKAPKNPGPPFKSFMRSRRSTIVLHDFKLGYSNDAEQIQCVPRQFLDS